MHGELRSAAGAAAPQLDSLRQQTLPQLGLRDQRRRLAARAARSNSRQEIAGDERFALVRGRASRLLPELRARPGASRQTRELVALCDQDDRWHRDKLERLVAAIGGAELVYSDATGGAPGRRRSSSPRTGPFGRTTTRTSPRWRWPTRSPGRRRSSAASCSPTRCRSRRRTMRPSTTTGSGWWRSCRGEIAYVDEPLYDYVQHEGAVIGHSRGEPSAALAARVSARAPGAARQSGHPSIYYHDWLQLLVFCEVLRLRCWARMTEPKRRALMRLIVGGPPAGRAGLAARAPRPRGCSGTARRSTASSTSPTAIAGGRAPELLALGRRRPGPLAPGRRGPPPPEVPGLRAPPPPAAPRG